jgi:hypothetical protein
VIHVNDPIEQSNLFSDHAPPDVRPIGTLKFDLAFCQNEFDFENFINEILSFFFGPVL